MSTVYSLAHHADYRCRHEGACCRAGWRVPVEAHRISLMQRAASEGRLPVAASRMESDGPLTVLALQPVGACTAYEPGTAPGTGRCAVHRVLGHLALPAACQYFPRIALVDARGTHITLSHVCPTAASALCRHDVPIAIVRDPEAFPGDVEYEGLDARGVLPPLLHPGMLMDLESYTAWERHAVATFADPAQSPATALTQLTADVAHLCAWTPRQGSLTGAVQRLGARQTGIDGCKAHRVFRTCAGERYGAVAACVPADLRPPPLRWDPVSVGRELVDRSWKDRAGLLKRYLAGKAFASWVAWQGRGLAAVVESLAMALSTVYVEAARGCQAAHRTLDDTVLIEAVRRADDMLVHRASPARLAEAASTRAATRSPGR